MNTLKNLGNEASPYIMLISVILFNILFISGMTSEFFEDRDTIIAGVIAFIGAVIGGSLTLIGVNETIQEGRRKENRETALLKLNYANLLTEKLSKIQKGLPFEEPSFNNNIKLFGTLYEGVVEAVTSTEALILGKTVTDAIDSLGRTVIKGRIDLMVNKVPDYDDLILSINEEFYKCFDAINIKMQEITEAYHK